MRRAHQVDGNQAAIVKTLRKVGALVEVLSEVGRGVPDLLVGSGGTLCLLEVKREPVPGEVKPSQCALTDAENVWHEMWCGYPVYVVHNEVEALAAIGIAA